MSFLSTLTSALSAPGQLVKTGLDYLTGNAQAKEQMQLSAQLQQENWEQQFEQSNLYNSPSAQIERLKAAGINPYLTSSGSAQVLSGLNTMSPSASAPSAVTQPKSLMQMVGDAVQAYKTLEEGSVVKPSAEADIGAKQAAARLDEINADREAFNLELDRIFGKDERSAALKNKQQEFFNMVADMEKLQGEARLAKAQEALTYLKQIQQEFANVGEKYAAGLLKKQHDSYEARLNNELSIGRSEQTKNYAAAGESSANAAKVQIENDVQGKLRDWFLSNQDKNLENYIQKLVTDGWISKKDAEEAIEKARNAHERNHNTWLRYGNYLLDKINVGSAVVIPFKK